MTVWRKDLFFMAAVLAVLGAQTAGPDETELKRAIASRPRDAAAHSRYAMFLGEQGRAGEALAHFRAAFGLDPRNPVNAYNLALALVGAGGAAEALAVLDKHPAGGGDHFAVRGAALLALGRFPEAVESLRKAVTLDPDNPDSLYDLIVTLLKTDRPKEAATLIETGLRRFPRVAKIHAAAGMIAYQGGRNAEAVRAYESAVNLEPEAADLHASLGGVYEAIGEAGRAQAAYERSLALDPSAAEVHVKAGRNLLKLDRAQEAEAVFHRALSLDQDNAEANFQLGKLAAARGDHTEAIARLAGAVKTMPGLKEAWYQLSLSYRRAGREQDAAAALGQFRKLP